jgi:tetratricopeptide (TPR) repeat protein
VTFGREAFDGVLITRDEVLDPPALFERAGGELAEKRFRDAARSYDLLVRSFSDSPYVVASLYNAGLAYEGVDDYKTARDRYRTLLDRFPDHADAVDASFKLGACLAELADWPASRAVYARLVDRKGLPLTDRMEAMTRRGYAELSQHDLATAERTFRETIAFYDAHEAEERLDTDFYLAMAHYELGVIAQEHYRAAPIRLPEQRMGEDLEAKAGLLLSAQNLYVRAIKVRNPHWAAAAGYQIGALYRDFYDAMIQAPLPEKLRHDAELRDVYMEELKKRIRPLLEKAVRTQEQTVLMAERTGIDNDFVRKASAELDALRRLLAPLGRPESREQPGPPPPVDLRPPGRRIDQIHKSG